MRYGMNFFKCSSSRRRGVKIAGSRYETLGYILFGHNAQHRLHFFGGDEVTRFVGFDLAKMRNGSDTGSRRDECPALRHRLGVSGS